MGGFETGQVCRNGHPITGNAQSQFAAAFCPSCGEETVTHCTKCRTHIRGNLSDAVWVSGWEPTAHCHACGSTYPWTAAKLSAVKELAEAVEELTTHEREILAELMPHLVQESPRTKPAGFKVATIVNKLPGPARDAFRGLFNDIVIEAGKSALGI